MLDAMLIAVVAASAVWVYLDATKNKIGEIPDSKNMFNVSAGAWGAVTLLLWIIGFPAYLIKRNTLIEKTKEHPIEVKGRGGKAAALSIFGGLWVLLAIVGIIQPTLPDCNNPEVRSALGQVISDSLLAKLSDAEFVSVKDEAELGLNEASQIRTCTGTVVTTSGEDAFQYTIKWLDRDNGEFEVEVQRQ